MEPTPDPDQINGWLIDECRASSNRLADIMRLSERITATGTALLALGANLAIGQNRSELLMTLPILFAALICYVAYINSEVFALGGYVTVLEEVLERRVGHPLLIWESRVAPQRHGAAPRLVFRIFLAGLWSAFSCAAIWQAFATRGHGSWTTNESRVLISAVIASIVFSLVAMIVALTGSAAERSKTIRITRQEFGL